MPESTEFSASSIQTIAVCSRLYSQPHTYLGAVFFGLCTVGTSLWFWPIFALCSYRFLMAPAQCEITLTSGEKHTGTTPRSELDRFRRDFPKKFQKSWARPL